MLLDTHIHEPMQNDDVMSVLLMIPRHYAEQLPLRTHILPLLSNFNFAENVLSQMDMSLLSYETLETLGSYLEWILAESKVSLPMFFPLLKAF